jgi:hypothetical protein
VIKAAVIRRRSVAMELDGCFRTGTRNIKDLPVWFSSRKWFLKDAQTREDRFIRRNNLYSPGE